MFRWFFSLLKRFLGYCEGCGVLSKTILCEDCRYERESWTRENTDSVMVPIRATLTGRYNLEVLNQKANGISQEV